MCTLRGGGVVGSGVSGVRHRPVVVAAAAAAKAARVCYQSNSALRCCSDPAEWMGSSG